MTALDLFVVTAIIS